jgi:hypothetical protein
MMVVRFGAAGEENLGRMNAVPPPPGKPGWYWDPRELEFNVPYLVGPTTRIHPETREESRRRLKLWVPLMTLSSVGVVVFELVK